LEKASALRSIPRTDHLLSDSTIAALAKEAGRPVVLAAIREAAAELRQRLRAGEPAGDDPLSSLREAVTARVAAAERRSLRPAINATGVVLHTGLGRAVLAEAAAVAVADAARRHSLLEVDCETGERGSRLAHVAGLLRELTGAEDALAVNNNAAAVFLGIAALAAGREVLIARGQLVEIGGSFRIPDVIRAAGARLVEVGTTNKVRAGDYAAALSSETALILRVHPSNFRIVGFTEEPTLEELVALGREHGVPVMDDMGSGALLDFAPHGLPAEPTVQAGVAAGVDLSTFSGDKLVVGRMELLARMRRHPLMRVLRLDKLTLAGVEATLRLYRDADRARREIPTLVALTADPAALLARARRLARLLRAAGLEVALEPGLSQVGGGSLPGEELPTTLVCVTTSQPSAGELARRLRVGEPSVWGRVRRDRLIFDPRTLSDREVGELAAAVRRALAL
jgi:L-seryl-tRNA(Ser) seleniumtransferase